MNHLKPDRLATNSSKPKQSQRKFLNYVGGVVVLLAFSGGLVWWEFIRQAIISYTANDYSDSALNYAKQQEKQGNASQYRELCIALSNNLKWQDTLITTEFANRPENGQEISVLSKRKLLSQCKQPIPASSDFGKLPGTSLPLLLQDVQTSLKKHRIHQDSRPVAINITLHAAEAGPEQPKLVFSEVATKINEITHERAVVAIIGPTGKLRQQLEQHLVDNPNVEICSFQEINRCVTWSIEQARKL